MVAGLCFEFPDEWIVSLADVMINTFAHIEPR